MRNRPSKRFGAKDQQLQVLLHICWRQCFEDISEHGAIQDRKLSRHVGTRRSRRHHGRFRGVLYIQYVLQRGEQHKLLERL